MRVSQPKPNIFSYPPLRMAAQKWTSILLAAYGAALLLGSRQCPILHHNMQLTDKNSPRRDDQRPHPKPQDPVTGWVHCHCTFNSLISLRAFIYITGDCKNLSGILRCCRWRLELCGYRRHGAAGETRGVYGVCFDFFYLGDDYWSCSWWNFVGFIMRVTG